MIDWGNWHTLLAVFRTGTYAGAAKMLRVDATTVGRRIRALERRLGYQLLLRENNRLHPTRQCERLLAHLETASEALGEAEQSTADQEQGAVWRDVRMTAPPVLVAHLFAPAIGRFASRRRVRVELVGTASKAGLQRREADIAIRIEDRPNEISKQDPRIASERIGALRYAVYRPVDATSASLPWAGLAEEHVRTSGDEVMERLASGDDFRYRTQQFTALAEIAAAGVARAMLPRLIGDADTRLAAMSGTVLEQPLWMLYHRQDQDVPHLKAARNWISRTAKAAL